MLSAQCSNWPGLGKLIPSCAAHMEPGFERICSRANPLNSTGTTHQPLVISFLDTVLDIWIECSSIKLSIKLGICEVLADAIYVCPVRSGCCRCRSRTGSLSHIKIRRKNAFHRSGHLWL